MAFAYTEAQSAQAVAELQWAKADKIMFTKFTSCIGLMGIKDDQVIGVHLPLRDDHNAVTNDDIDAAIALLDGVVNPVIIGAISAWKASASDVFTHLVDTLNPVEQYPYGDGIYGGSVDDGRVQPEYTVE
ncbi:hypothetical protein UF64_09495 [Thalassospira sp. HJ]|uniref:hypothetical protein n=1 Tax=Thalassospira sp. HJ TaxID=1616823 RepID=UPI0005CEC739|nr:hypothetical protein [Thalassospira sp. HJ]KJE34939.1 hypothetical protein UF64_09495 [Thalassospira sp. HJ]